MTADRYLVIASAEDRLLERPVEVVAEAGRTRDGLVLRLGASSRVSGLVLQGGRPVAGATVSLELVRTSRRALEAISQEDGRFTIERAPRGDSVFAVSDFEVVAPRTRTTSVVIAADPD